MKFYNDLAKNTVIFGIDDFSSSHSDNCKNKFLMIGEGPAYGINGSFGLPKRKFSTNFTKAKITLFEFTL